MTDEQENNTDDIYEAYSEIGEKFGLGDPFEEIEKDLKEMGADPIDLYIRTKIMNKNITEGKKTDKISIIKEWKSHMAKFDRHHACPNLQHVSSFIEKEIQKGNNKKRTVGRIRVIEKMFSHWRDLPLMPHAQENLNLKDNNPITTVLKHKEDEIADLDSDTKPEHRIPISELGHIIREVKNIFRRSILVTQFKYGIRGGQTSRIQLQDINIENEELKDLYPQLGTHPRIRAKDENVIHFPSRDERPGVKSIFPTIMPIDEETKYTLIKYLQVRPPVDESWLFLKPSNTKQLNTDYIRNRIWHPVFHPEYAETEDRQPIGSHFARHRFTTYWRKEMNLNDVLIDYMRGARAGQMNFEVDDKKALYNYVHSYYEDIRDEYLLNIYKFDI